MTTASDQLHFALVQPRHQPVAIELDLVDPFPGTRHAAGECGKLGADFFRQQCLPAALQARTFDRQEPSSAAISDISNQAKYMKQRMDILSDVQTLLKRKTLAKRRIPSKKKCCDCEDDCDCEDTCEKEETCPKPAACPTPASRPPASRPPASRPKPSAALSQGKEYKKACDHDMSQYIRKDSIPCWNCNLDY